MPPTHASAEKRTDQTVQSRLPTTHTPSDCDPEWCHGPTTDPLPCFACFRRSTGGTDDA